MIEETAIVTETDGEFATVETQRSTTCGDCSAKPACGTSALAKVMGRRRTVIHVLNPIGAKSGERVVVGLQETALTKASFVFYITPLLLLLLFSVAGERLAIALNFNSTEPVTILCGLLGLSAGLIWLKFYATRISRDKRYQAVILRRTDELKISVGFS